MAIMYLSVWLFVRLYNAVLKRQTVYHYRSNILVLLRGAAAEVRGYENSRFSANIRVYLENNVRYVHG